MSPLLLALLLCLVGILGSALYSGVETGAYTFNRTRHRLALAEGSSRAHLVQVLTNDMTGFVVLCLVGTNLSNALVSFSTTLAFEHMRWQNPDLISTVLIGPILFMLGELLPKELFRRHADRLVYATAPLLRLSALLLRPATLLLEAVNWILLRLGLRGAESGDRLHAQERIRQAVAAGREGGTLTAYQSTLAHNIFALEKRTVHEVMQPLDDVDCVEASMELNAARAFATSRRHTRYPVYRDRRRQVVGVVHAWDLVFEERPGLTVRNYVRDPVYVRPETRVVDALYRLRRKRTNMAVVAREPDEQGRREALGVVTLKDLVEEITGELTDL